jgi:hypothetical protein
MISSGDASRRQDEDRDSSYHASGQRLAAVLEMLRTDPAGDVMHAGKRWRMPVDEFAISRGATEPVTSKPTAERVWEPKFLGEIVAGRDPRVAPNKPAAEGVLTVADFLDRYYTLYVEPEGLKSVNTVAGHIKALKKALGDLPVTALEKPQPIARFKAAYRHGHEIATVNRALGVLRAAINW